MKPAPWLFLLAFVTLTPIAWASSGQVTGTVTDTLGAVVPEASVFVRNPDTGLLRRTTSNAVGRFSVPMLPPGSYSILVSKEGFRPASHSRLRLELDQAVEIDFVLRVGTLTEELEVTTATPVLNTVEGSQAQVIRSKRMVEMPLNGRDYIQLALLSAGAMHHINGRVKGFSAAGQRTTQNNYTIDGIDNNGLQIAAQSRRAEVVKPPVDAIREFKLSTNSYSAASGRGLGGAVNVSIRSGSNDFHGTAYYFLRNEVFDAKNFFDPPDDPKPPFKRSQLGFAAGGPIVRNRTFFFADFEQTMVRESATHNLTIPTPQQLAGDFSAVPQTIFDPETYSAATGARQPFPNNVVPRARLDPVAQAAARWYPEPNRPALTQNFLYSSPDIEDITKWDLRIDQQVGDADNFFARFSQQLSTAPGALALPSALDGNGTDFAHHGHNFGLVWSHTFSSQLVANIKFGWNRIETERAAIATTNLNREIGLNGVDQSLPGAARFSISGVNNIGTSNYTPNNIGSQNRQFDADLALLSGSHSIRFGYSLQLLESLLSNPQQQLGHFLFNGNFTRQTDGIGGRPVADFLLGIPFRTDISDAVRMSLYSPWNAFYIEDSWKATQRLTLTFGLRYELTLPWVERDNGIANFDIDTDPRSPSFFVARNGGWMDRATVKPDLNNLAPRFGFAYRLDGETVLRGGYGIFYATFEPTGGGQFLETNPPFHLKSQITTDSIHPSVLLRTGVPPVVSSPEYAAALQLSSFEREPTWPMSQQWNLNVQHSFDDETVLEIGYYAAKSNHLVNRINANWALPGPGDINPRRRYTEVALPRSGVVVGPLASMNRHENNGNSLFHSLQARLERNYSNGLSVLAGYIYSRTFGDIPGFSGSGNAPHNGIQNPRDRRAERSLDDLHRKHSAVVSYIYDLPFGQSHSGFKRALFAGWTLAGITSFTSGRPFGLRVRGDPANTGDANRPNVVGDPILPGDERSPERWFNTSAFVANDLYEFGNAGRNVLLGPATMNLDFAVYKRFQVTEGKYLQFRFEAFNATNTPAFGFPNSEVGNNNFGRITSAGRPRNLQLGLKFLF